jgi:acyl-coenzyme A thioesterase PaaI-like protein
VRDLGHALVGHDAPPDVLEQVAFTVEGLAAELSRGARRMRPGRDMQNRMQEEPPPDGGTFETYADRPVSGVASPWGVDLVVTRDGQVAVGSCVLRAAHEGAPGRSHGGVTAAVFDDLFGFVLAIEQVMGFTGELTIRYVGPTPLHTPLEFRTWLVGKERRKLFMEGTASADGVVFATSKATFISADVSGAGA